MGALADICVWGGCDEVKVIAHQYKRVDDQVVIFTSSPELIAKNIPDVLHGEFEPLSVDASCSDIIGEL